MNAIEELREYVLREVDNADATLDIPLNPQGSWWLDVRRGTRTVVIEWRPGRGFGISKLRSDEFGLGPDEIYTESQMKKLVSRLRQLLIVPL